MKRVLKNWVLIAVAQVLAFSTLRSTLVRAASTPPDATADLVYGQLGCFSTNGFTSADVLNSTARLRVDSGRFMVRIPPELHRQLALEAAESGVSLNRLASDKLSRVR